jgi:hypothetical protein
LQEEGVVLVVMGKIERKHLKMLQIPRQEIKEAEQLVEQVELMVMVELFNPGLVLMAEDQVQDFMVMVLLMANLLRLYHSHIRLLWLAVPPITIDMVASAAVVALEQVMLLAEEVDTLVEAEAAFRLAHVAIWVMEEQVDHIV